MKEQNFNSQDAVMIQRPINSSVFPIDRLWVYGVELGIAPLTVIPIQVYSFVKFLLFMFAALSAACWRSC